MADTKEEVTSGAVMSDVGSFDNGKTTPVLDSDSVDPVYQAKAQVLNNAIQEIGMGRYQWELVGSILRGRVLRWQRSGGAQIRLSILCIRVLRSFAARLVGMMLCPWLARHQRRHHCHD